jgi:MoaA/NifB/PqqE/SkfB family radical SAM enzyme
LKKTREGGKDVSSELLSPFNPLKILHYGDRLQDLIFKGKIPTPAMVSFDFSNPCNHKCVWCSWEEHRIEEGGMLPEEVFWSILDDCKELGITGYEVCGGGEPLIHPHATEFLSALGDAGDLLLITNGSRLTPEIADKCKTIRISLDAAYGDTHFKLHQAVNFEEILDNIAGAARRTRVGLGFLIHPDNYEEIPNFAVMARELGCEFAHIRPCYTDYPIIRDRIGFDWFTWMQEKADEVRGLISKAKNEETDDFKVYATLYKTKPKQEWAFDKCYAAYFNPLISPTGGVWICCERRGVQGSLIGTIGIDGSFQDIWFSEKHKTLMKSCPNNLCPAKDKYLGMNQAIDAAYVKRTLDLNWI